MSTLGTSKDVFSFILEFTLLTPGTAACSHGRCYAWKIYLSPNILCCSTIFNQFNRLPGVYKVKA